MMITSGLDTIQLLMAKDSQERALDPEDDFGRFIEDISPAIDTAPWYDEVMECPRCGEIELYHVRTSKSLLPNRVFKEYRCGACNHEENHWVKR